MGVSLKKKSNCVISVLNLESLGQVIVIFLIVIIMIIIFYSQSLPSGYKKPHLVLNQVWRAQVKVKVLTDRGHPRPVSLISAVKKTTRFCRDPRGSDGREGDADFGVPSHWCVDPRQVLLQMPHHTRFKGKRTRETSSAVIFQEQASRIHPI